MEDSFKPMENQSGDVTKKPTATTLFSHSEQWRPYFRIFLCLVFVRICNALFLATFFVPDEYWQSLEIAYKLVFGYGQVTWEWLPSISIRGYLHPFFFVPIYSFIKYFKLNTTDLLVILPKLQQGVLAAVCDYFTWRVATFLYNKEVGRWALFASLISWFNFYALTRTLSNSFCASTLMVSLYFWHKPKPNYFLSFCFMGITTVVRPPIVPLLLLHTLFYFPFRSSFHRRRCLLALFSALLLVVFVELVMDTVGIRLLFPDSPNTWKHVWRFAPYQFLHFNVLHNVSSMYGVHPYHWYVTQGLPSVLGSFILIWPWTLLLCDQLSIMVVGTVSVMSLVAHKEHRFLMDFHPLLLIGLARGLTRLRERWPTKYFKSLVLGMALIQFGLAIFFSRFHQRGNMDIMGYLRRYPGHVFALVPCHTVLGYAHFGHADYKLQGFACEPGPLFPQPHGEEQFYSNVHEQLVQWDWQARWQFRKADYIVVFDGLWQKYNQSGVLLEYHECARFFYSYIYVNPRRKGDILVLCSNTNSPSSKLLTAQ